MWLTITLYCIAYFIMATITYGIAEYLDLEVDEYTGEVKKKGLRFDDDCPPNGVIALFWPIAWIIFIFAGPFEFASWMAKKIKQMQNPKKLDINKIGNC